MMNLRHWPEGKQIIVWKLFTAVCGILKEVKIYNFEGLDLQVVFISKLYQELNMALLTNRFIWQRSFI